MVWKIRNILVQNPPKWPEFLILRPDRRRWEKVSTFSSISEMKHNTGDGMNGIKRKYNFNLCVNTCISVSGLTLRF